MQLSIGTLACAFRHFFQFGANLGSKMKTVLFVCSGNIFRSVTAQRALSKEIVELRQQDDFRSESAGTSIAGAVMRSDLMNAWKNHGLFPGNHTPRQVSKDLLERTSAVLSMGFDHQELIWRQFKHQTYLFNQIAHGKNEPILDVWEAVENHEHNLDAATKYIEDTVQYIIASTPNLFRKLTQILG